MEVGAQREHDGDASIVPDRRQVSQEPAALVLIGDREQLLELIDDQQQRRRHGVAPEQLVDRRPRCAAWRNAAQPHGPGRSRAPVPRTYRVSNIRELAVHGAFARPARFDLSAYWGESTRRFEREIYRGTADVRLSPRGRKLLCSASAAVEDAIDAALARPPGAAPDGWLRVTIPIESLGHATGQLLSLGTDAEVLGPPELRARVRDTAGAVVAQYRARAAPARRTPRPRKLA